MSDPVTTGATFAYDANGNLLTHVEGTKTITRAYDSLNRLTSITLLSILLLFSAGFCMISRDGLEHSTLAA